MRLSTIMRAALMCGVATAALGASANSWAQNVSNGNTTTLQRIVKGAGEDKVAVDTPQAVTVVEQGDIDETQAVTVGDVFKQIPGANTSGSERVLGESFVIRGIGAGEDQGDEGRFIVNVDGVDKAYQQYRMGSFFSDAELYKRVEVLRGPASSTLYGSGALAGTILFVTKDASDFIKDGDTWSLRLKSAFETNQDIFLGSTTAAWRPNDNAEFLLSGNFRRGMDYEAGDGSVIDADFESFSGIAKGTFYFGDGNEQSLRASYQRWQSEAENQQYAQTVNSATFGRIDRNVTDETYILAYENPDSDNPWIDFKAQVSYSDTISEERNGSFIFFGPPPPIGPPAVQAFPDADFRYESWQAKAENTIETRIDMWENFFTFGVQWNQLNRQLLLRSTGAQPTGTDEKLGIFVQNEFTYDDRLTLIPGMRIDWRTLTPDNATINGFAANGSTAPAIDDVAYSPKIAALYKFNENFSIFGSYAHTQRFPTLDEVYDYRTGAVAGTGLTKELSNNFEAGFAITNYDWLQDGDSVQLKTTAFRNYIQDFIWRSPVARSPQAGGPGPGPAYLNIGDVLLTGIELEASYSSDNWYGSLGASVIDGQDLDKAISSSGNLNTVPGHELFMTLGYKLPDDGISFGWKGRFVAEQNEVLAAAANGRRPSSGFGTHDLFFNWLPPEGQFEGVEFRASVENVFDQEYREFLANDKGKGRTFKFSLVTQIGG